MPFNEKWRYPPPSRFKVRRVLNLAFSRILRHNGRLVEPNPCPGFRRCRERDWYDGGRRESYLFYRYHANRRRWRGYWASCREDPVGSMPLLLRLRHGS